MSACPDEPGLTQARQVVGHVVLPLAEGGRQLAHAVRAVGEDAQGEAYIEVEGDGQRVRARAVSTDIVEASARAFVKALNQLVAGQSAGPPVAEASP